MILDLGRVWEERSGVVGDSEPSGDLSQSTHDSPPYSNLIPEKANQNEWRERRVNDISHLSLSLSYHSHLSI